MKKIFVLLVMQVGLMTSCQQYTADDPEKLKATLIGYFDGIKTKDFQKMKNLTTDDFILYEDGKIFNNDSLINLLKTFPKFKGEYTFDSFRINVDNTIGNISYINHGEFIFDDTAHMSFNWLESASLIKVDGKWKIQFLHSTIRK